LSVAALAFSGVATALQAAIKRAPQVHGDKALKVLGVYVVDKSRPLASPAP
jgi:hypothetical protein